MGRLEEINQKVQQKINQRHRDLILYFYQKKIYEHNDFCGCNCCIELDFYVKLKKQKASINKKFKYYEIEYGNDVPIDIEIKYLKTYREIEYGIKFSKQEIYKLKTL